MDWDRHKTHLHTDNTRSSVSVHRDVSSPRSFQSHNNTKSNRGNKRNRHNKYLLSVVLCLSQLANVPTVKASDVGGVSATASPIANSSGSVTNQAIQVLQGPYITNTYGDGIQCQGAPWTLLHTSPEQERGKILTRLSSTIQCTTTQIIMTTTYQTLLVNFILHPYSYRSEVYSEY